MFLRPATAARLGHRSRAVAFSLLMAVSAIASSAETRSVVAPPLANGPYPVACSDVAYDTDKMNRIGGSAADFWEGNPLYGRPRYFTDILAEPADTLQVAPMVPDDAGFYVQTWNRQIPFVILVCYPTDASNSRPDYPLPKSLAVPKMQRAGQKPIFPLAVPGPLAPGQEDPNRFPLLILSHGLSGSPLNGNSLEVMNRLASFGYVVAAPFHGDARFTVVNVDTIGDLLTVLYDFDRFVEMEALRPLSLKATVDAVLAHPDFGPHINPERIGGFGASMGGAAMTLLLGASVTDGLVSQNSHATVREPRIKAAVGYVPYAGENFVPAFGESNATAANVTTPYLAICGTADTVAPMGRMVQAANRFGGAHYLVALSGVEHGYEESYAGDVFGWTMAFLNAYVRGDSGALRTFARQKTIAGGLDDNVLIDYTPPALDSRVDCLFDWAERNYPQFFSPPAGSSRILSPYYFRYYSATAAYLGSASADDRVHYLDAGGFRDLGSLSGWIDVAGCR